MMKKILLALVLFVSISGVGCSSEDSGGCPADTQATCGNGIVEAGEDCDQGNAAASIPPDFNNQSCATQASGTEGALQCQCCMIDNSLCMPGQGPVGGSGI